MAKRGEVVLTMTPTQAGEVSLALQMLEIEAGDNGYGLRAHRINQILIKLDTARVVAKAL